MGFFKRIFKRRRPDYNVTLFLTRDQHLTVIVALDLLKFVITNGKITERATRKYDSRFPLTKRGLGQLARMIRRAQRH